MRKGRQGRHDRDAHGKRGVRRHQVQCRARCDSLDRAIERVERQGARKEIERELEELDRA